MSTSRVVRLYVSLGLGFLVTSGILTVGGQDVTGQQRIGPEVRLIVQTKIGLPVGHLRSSDFRITQGAYRYRARVIQPVTGRKPPDSSFIPTRLLVICAPHLAADPHALATIVQSLTIVWQRDWQVSILRPDGMETEYVSSQAALEEAMASPSLTKLAPKNSIEGLASFPGRRILLYVSALQGSPKENAPWGVRHRALQSMAEVYVTDGEHPRCTEHIYTYLEGSDAEVPGPTESIGGITVLPEAPGATVKQGACEQRAKADLKFGVLHEETLQKAVRAIERDAEGFYELDLACNTNQCPNFQMPLSIKIDRPGPLRVTAEGIGTGSALQLNITAE